MGGGDKTAFILEVEGEEKFRCFADLLMTQLNMAATCFKFFVHEEATPMPEFMQPAFVREYYREAEVVVRDFIDHAIDSGKFQSRACKYCSGGGRGLADDPACQISFLIGSMNSIM